MWRRKNVYRLQGQWSMQGPRGARMGGLRCPIFKLIHYQKAGQEREGKMSDREIVPEPLPGAIAILVSRLVGLTFEGKFIAVNANQGAGPESGGGEREGAEGECGEEKEGRLVTVPQCALGYSVEV